MATHSSVLAWRIPGTGSLMGCRLWGCTESDMTEATRQEQEQNPSNKISTVCELGTSKYTNCPLEKDMATHPRILAWKIPGTAEPGGLQSIGPQRVRHN